MRRGYRLAIKQRFGYLSAAVIIYLLDQLTKALATHYLPEAGYHQGVSVIDGFFHLTYVENAGIAWGLFADAGTGGRLALGAISFIAATGIILYAVRTPVSERVTHWGLTLVLGGVLGNLTDRLVRGAVIDFLDFTIGSYRWPTFNIADMAISVGAAILILDALRSPKTERQAHPVEGLPSE
ncbi:MAG: signal peptidase II [Acidobacteria bacterium]|nr:MAG: signal peptidase II [Acidobacteriota bacterium]